MIFYVTPHAKALYKALSYRVLSLIVTFIISYTITGDLTLATSIMSVDFVFKMVLFYVHERGWSKYTKPYSKLKAKEVNATKDFKAKRISEAEYKKIMAYVKRKKEKRKKEKKKLKQLKKVEANE